MITPRDLRSEKFGKLTPLRSTFVHVGTKGKRRTAWICLCKCGPGIEVETKPILENNLMRGLATSCGCQKFGRGGGRFTDVGNRTIHGEARHVEGGRTVEYETWHNVVQRCCNPKSKDFRAYGGRGIQMHEAWANSFEAFLADMGRRPSPNHSIDRFPNNDGNYEPGNVRWATRSEQQRNKRTNHWITYQGRRLTMAAWSEWCGEDPRYLHNRLYQGLSEDEAVRQALAGRPLPPLIEIKDDSRDNKTENHQ